MAGRASVPADHPNYVFGFGPAGDLARSEADVVLVAGSRMGNLDLPYDKYWGDPAGQRLIQIDVDPRNFGVTRPLHLGIVADARSALEGLAERLRATRLASARRRGSRPLSRARPAGARRSRRRRSSNGRAPGSIRRTRSGAIGAVFGRDAVYTADGGNTSLWAHYVLPPTRPRSYHSILELGMLGTGIPSAIGAKLGAPDREVVCVTGDGAAGFNFMEMQSAARERLKITVIVLRRRHVDDGGTQRAQAVRHDVRHGSGRDPLGHRRGRPRLPRRIRRPDRGPRPGAAARPADHAGPAWSACAPTTTQTSRFPRTWLPASSRSTADPPKKSRIRRAASRAALRPRGRRHERRTVDLTGKIAVITGAGSGIGRATARLIARHGARVHSPI